MISFPIAFRVFVILLNIDIFYFLKSNTITMCGRYWLKSEKKVLINEFNIYEVMADDKSDYNITPGRNVLCVTRQDSPLAMTVGNKNNNLNHPKSDDVASCIGHNKLVSMRWGLIPSWAKDEQIGYRTINARAETLTEKPSFLRPFQTQRCLVIADGFYEWRKEIKKKTPLAVRLKNNRPFGFAGLYDKWQSPKGDLITSCTIITTEPNELVASIHNRMPAILTVDAREIWLDRNLSDPYKLMSLLIPFDADEMESYEVSALVNSVKNNSPNLIEPL